MLLGTVDGLGIRVWGRPAIAFYDYTVQAPCWKHKRIWCCPWGSLSIVEKPGEMALLKAEQKQPWVLWKYKGGVMGWVGKWIREGFLEEVVYELSLKEFELGTQSTLTAFYQERWHLDLGGMEWAHPEWRPICLLPGWSAPWVHHSERCLNVWTPWGVHLFGESVRSAHTSENPPQSQE